MPDPASLKTCAGCGAEKPLSPFKATGATGRLRARCIACERRRDRLRKRVRR